MSRILSYIEAIREAIDLAMANSDSVFVMGLGVDYANGGDGTTTGLAAKYPGRVFDTPCSENATTGFCTGAAIAGMRPIIYHGRVEFALFAFDQIVTQAAKWNYMFGGDSPVPAVYRIAVGRRWGDAPQHTSVLHSIFAHIPGLKVVVPSTPRMAKGLLMTAIADNNPVVFLEHRWLYNIRETVPPGCYGYPLEAAHIRIGKDLTMVVNSDTYIEALHCLPALRAAGIKPEIIDLVSLNPIDYRTILESVRKTGRLIVADVGTKALGIGNEIVARVCEDPETYHKLKEIPVSIATPDCPCPMSPALAMEYYPVADTILDSIAKMSDFLNLRIKREWRLNFQKLHMPSDENIDELEEWKE